MIPATAKVPREVHSSGVQASASFGISRADEAHIMGILRDGLYSDKIMAVLREYGANAWDAHRAAGKEDVPIKVTLPTNLAPTLKIRDFGEGLSHTDVFQVYTQYGASTKRGSDNAVGMLGIGSKSGFAYTDGFTITSFHEGVKRVYSAVLDESERGKVNLLLEEACGPDESGIEIQIPARPVDIREFHLKATRLFRHFEPLPDINIPLPTTHREASNEYGYVTQDSHEWVAIMGCVPYRIDMQQVRAVLEQDGLFLPASKFKGGLYFDIGEIRVTSNRENVKYTDKTRDAIAAKMRLLVDDYIETTLAVLKDKTVSDWEKRCKATFLGRTLGLRVPKRYNDWVLSHADLFGVGKDQKPKGAKTFQLRGRRAVPQRHVAVVPGAKLYIVAADEERQLQGFAVNHYDMFITPFVDTDPAAVRTELDALLKVAKLTGIEIGDLSTVSWTKPYVYSHGGSNTSTRKPNAKHRVSAFRLKSDDMGNEKLSDNWEIVKRVPTDDDVFVIISHFQSRGGFNVYSLYERDARLAKRLGIEMPEVYGYKTTQRKQIETEDCTGTLYTQWRRKTFAKHVNAKHKRLFNALGWSTLMGGYSLRRLRRDVPGFTKLTADLLGEGHPLTKVLKRYAKACKIVQKASQADLNASKELSSVLQPKGSRHATETLTKVFAPYPLLKHRELSLYEYAGDTTDWLTYIKAMDFVAANSVPVPVPVPVHASKEA